MELRVCFSSQVGDYPPPPPPGHCGGHVHTRRCSSVIHEMCWRLWAHSILGSPLRGRGESRGALNRSFLHLHLTHFATLLFRQYNHFNNCLPSSATATPTSPLSHSSFYLQERWCICRQTHRTFSTSLSYEGVLCVKALWCIFPALN